MCIRDRSEAIAVTGSNAYISNWTDGHEIMVISTLSDKVTDSIIVGKEPESMAFDRTGILWVICNGGWDRQTFAELDQISTCLLYTSPSPRDRTRSRMPS